MQSQDNREVIVVQSAGQVVPLPDGTALDDIVVQGDDLLVTLPDGSVLVLVNGAVVVPALEIYDSVVMPTALAALLDIERPEPAAGDPESSGGNFFAPVDPIQPAYALGDLLPYTELFFTQPEDEDLMTGLLDRDPTDPEEPEVPTNAIPAITAESAEVFEAGLPARDTEDGREPAGTDAGSGSDETAGQVTFTSPDGVSVITIDGQPAVTIVDGQPVIAEQFVTGQALGSGILTITAIDLAAGTLTYSYQLLDNTLGEDTPVSFEVGITDPQGDERTDTVTITINDDAPIANPDGLETTVAVRDVNAAFVFDMSRSIDNNELAIEVAAVKSAAQALFEGTNGSVSVQVVIFSAFAINLGTFSNLEELSEQLDSISPLAGGERPFTTGTNYTAGIESLMDGFAPDPGASNMVFFMSDGRANTQTGSDGHPLADDTAIAWQAFVDDNALNVVTLGVGDRVNFENLSDIDADGIGNPIVVEDFDQLFPLLTDIVQDTFNGNVLANDVVGADGARILSIEIDGITYEWDGAQSITASDGGSIAGSTLDLQTASGGHFQFSFANGAYSYEPSSSATTSGAENFEYRLIDGDDDIASATLQIDIEPAQIQSLGVVASAGMAELADHIVIESIVNAYQGPDAPLDSSEADPASVAGMMGELVSQPVAFSALSIAAGPVELETSHSDVTG